MESTASGLIALGALIISLYAFVKYLRKSEARHRLRLEEQKKAEALALEEQRKKDALSLIQRPLDIIRESIKLVTETKSLKTMVHRFDVIANNIESVETTLRQFNQPDLITPSPEQLRKEILGHKQVLIRDLLLREADRNIERAKAVTRKSSKITILDKAILMLVDGRNELTSEPEKQRLIEKESIIRALIGALD